MSFDSNKSTHVYTKKTASIEFVKILSYTLVLELTSLTLAPIYDIDSAPKNRVVKVDQSSSITIIIYQISNLIHQAFEF